MTILAPMQEAAFALFREEAVRSFAEDNIHAARWPQATALARASRAFERLLPQGLATPDHYLFEIRADVDGPGVGALWFAIVGADDHRTGYVYNIRVAAAHRGQGHARGALLRLEEIARGLGLSGIALHVFGFNTSAQALYRSLGYGVTGFNMLKPLSAAGAQLR